MNTTENMTSTENDSAEPTGRATYCPEDNKLRLYVGRVPRNEYEALRAQGWTSTPKQDCDFVATWTPARRDTALDYAGIIEDEDQSPAERAADRAERFAGYREKRSAEANNGANRYESGPSAFGFQSQARAERAAARWDRVAARAVDAWDKAEYWQRRTAGVIAHALHVCAPHVRMGRIKELESEIRKAEKNRAERMALRALWVKIAAETDAQVQNTAAERAAGASSGWMDYEHPRPEEVKNAHIAAKGSSLWTLLTMHGGEYGKPITGAEAAALYLDSHPEETGAGEWETHYRNRLAYEEQMLEAQGGRAGAVEIEVGGWLRGGRHLTGEERQIIKVNKSPASGRVVSVDVRDNRPSAVNHWGNPFPAGVTKTLVHNVEIERLSPDCYRAPTAEELAEFEAATKAEKAAAKAAKPTPPPLVNPTDEDAERLQAMWNEKARAAFFEANPHHKADHFKPSTVRRVTQANYSASSVGTYSRAATANLCGGALCVRSADYEGKLGRVLAKIRTTYGDGNTTNKAASVIILTDKPQKPLPAALWVPYLAPVAEPALVTA